ncbi:Diphosphoinositol polyphosphate phosphohydrolase 1 [Nosema granulosis]|uniref:Diphosphoinositol polyphosphate phosphohydrolase 1 n=1 Tax=Nosema granulosis TaxID=83296 RepID=A0A9P6GXT7_9MICR|nr:Diphosphoinositol polyphosphate phosphohydrolase 1 [Nosema granulosis]
MSKTTKAGTIPVYGKDVILVQSIRHPGRLVLPKGKIKKGENPLDAAKRETLEETGAIGTIDPTVVFYNDSTVYYLMRVDKLLKNYDEKDERHRQQMKFDHVEDSLRVQDKIKRIVRDTKKHLE